MPVAAQDVIQEIEERMPGFSKDGQHKKLVGEVGAYLSDGEAVYKQLQALDQAMLMKLNERLMLAKQPKVTVAEAQKPFEERYTLNQKHHPHWKNLLTTVLQGVEQANGFAPQAHVNPLLLVDFVAPDAFRPKVLQTKIPFKDPAVLGIHGEFTHRIQWYCIMTAGFSPPKTWGDFYEWIGGVAHTTKKTPDKPEWGALGLWDALFDRNGKNGAGLNGPYNTAKGKDFRSPENLQVYLTTKWNALLPLLSTFILVREARRVDAGMRDEKTLPKAMQDYVSRKLYPGKNYSGLDPTEQGEVNKLLKEAIRIQS
jgi:hypothetical protein